MTGAAMAESKERREQRGEHLFEGRLSDSVQRLWLRYYPVSRHARFKELLLRNIRPTDHVLEIGAGSGTANQNHFDLRGRVARYVGVDPDKSVLQNSHLDEAYSCTADSLPFPDETFDLAFHYYVAEHFEKPMACHREIARVLKPGGLLLFQTPSRYWYPMLAAQVTPQWFHEFYVRHFGSGRTANEVFPTRYKFNDERAIREQLRIADLPVNLNIAALRPATCALAGLVSCSACSTKEPSKKDSPLCACDRWSGSTQVLDSAQFFRVEREPQRPRPA